MRKYIYSFFVNILILSFVFKAFTGISVSSETVYSILTFFCLSAAILLYKPFLRFLTVKVNFITYWLSVSLLLIGAFFLLNAIMPGFDITDTSIRSMNFEVVQIASFEMNMLLTIIFASMSVAFVSAIMEFLQKGDSYE